MSNSAKIEIERSNNRSGSIISKKKVLRKRGKRNELKPDISRTEKTHSHQIFNSFLTNLTLLAPPFVRHSDVIAAQQVIKYNNTDNNSCSSKLRRLGIMNGIVMHDFNLDSFVVGPIQMILYHQSISHVDTRWLVILLIRLIYIIERFN